MNWIRDVHDVESYHEFMFDIIAYRVTYNARSLNFRWLKTWRKVQAYYLVPASCRLVNLIPVLEFKISSLQYKGNAMCFGYNHKWSIWLGYLVRMYAMENFVSLIGGFRSTVLILCVVMTRAHYSTEQWALTSFSPVKSAVIWWLIWRFRK